MDSLHDELEQALDARRRHRKLTAARAHTAQALSRAERELDEHGAILDREAKDVRRLEGVSLTRFFTALFGDRDAKLEQERRELAAAKLRYDERLAAVEASTTEIAELDGELADLGDVDARYRDVLARRETAARQGNDELARELTGVVERLAEVRADAREIDEALTAARAAEQPLRDAAGALAGARTWGRIDMLGGGLLTTMVKHGRLGSARTAATRAQHALNKLQRELGDVGEHFTGVADIGGLLRFADYFFDGLLVDLVVQARISDAQDRIAKTLEQVQDVRERLRVAAGDLGERSAELALRRENLLGGGE